MTQNIYAASDVWYGINPKGKQKTYHMLIFVPQNYQLSTLIRKNINNFDVYVMWLRCPLFIIARQSISTY